MTPELSPLLRIASSVTLSPSMKVEFTEEDFNKPLQLLWQRSLSLKSIAQLTA